MVCRILIIISEKCLATPDCFPIYFVNAESMESYSMCSETEFISEQLYIVTVYRHVCMCRCSVWSQFTVMYVCVGALCGLSLPSCALCGLSLPSCMYLYSRFYFGPLRSA